jgi:hypothetical protein
VKVRRAKIRENKMDRFSFGPRDNSIIQIAYSVADIQEEMRRYTELLHIGPWFLVGPFVPPKGVYRGAVTKMRVSLAFAYSGELMIELIEQHDKEPSVFQETLKARGAHGFHQHARLRKNRSVLPRAWIPASILGYRPSPIGVPRHLFRHRARPARHARSHRDKRRDGRGLSPDLRGRPGMERKRSQRASQLTAIAGMSPDR